MLKTSGEGVKEVQQKSFKKKKKKKKKIATSWGVTKDQRNLETHNTLANTHPT
jgi:hypothetical protein